MINVCILSIKECFKDEIRPTTWFGDFLLVSSRSFGVSDDESRSKRSWELLPLLGEKAFPSLLRGGDASTLSYLSGLNTPLTPLTSTVAPTLHKTLLNSIQVFEMTRAGVQKFQLEQLYLAMTWTSCVLDTSPDLVRNLK